MIEMEKIKEDEGLGGLDEVYYFGSPWVILLYSKIKMEVSSGDASSLSYYSAPSCPINIPLKPAPIFTATVGGLGH